MLRPRGCCWLEKLYSPGSAQKHQTNNTNTPQQQLHSLVRVQCMQSLSYSGAVARYDVFSPIAEVRLQDRRTVPASLLPFMWPESISSRPAPATKAPSVDTEPVSPCAPRNVIMLPLILPCATIISNVTPGQLGVGDGADPLQVPSKLSALASVVNDRSASRPTASVMRLMVRPAHSC